MDLQTEEGTIMRVNVSEIIYCEKTYGSLKVFFADTEILLKDGFSDLTAKLQAKSPFLYPGRG